MNLSALMCINIMILAVVALMIRVLIVTAAWDTKGDGRSSRLALCREQSFGPIV